MMSTVGLELMNFVNPDLAWTKVAKGCRSGSRRSRKTIAGNFTVGTLLSDKGTRKNDETAVSDTEKNGVAVLGRRFGDKVEQVPIKKRRSMVQSSSPPPPVLSPNFEVYKPNLSSKRQRRAKETSTAAKLSQEISEVKDSKLCDSDDFSGIEILAAVACSSSMVNDNGHDEESSRVEDLTREGAESSTAAVSPKDLAFDDKMEASSLQNSALTDLQKSISVKDSRTTGESVTTQNERLHWDLNVNMDVWGQHCDVSSVDSLENAVESTSTARSKHESENCEVQRETKDIKHNSLENVDSLENAVECTSTARSKHESENCDVQRETKDIKRNSLERVDLSDVHADCHISADLKCLPTETYRAKTGEPESEPRTGLGGSHNGECVISPTDMPQEITNCAITDSNSSSQIVNMDTCLDHAACPSVCGQDGDASFYGLTNKQSVSSCSSDHQVGTLLCTSSIKVEEHYDALTSGSQLEKATSEIKCKFSTEDGKSIQGMAGLDSQQTIPSVSLGVEPACEAEESDDCHRLPDGANISGSNALSKEPAMVSVDDKQQVSHVDSPAHAGSEELLQKSSVDSTFTSRDTCRKNRYNPGTTLSKITGEDPSDDSFESDVYQVEKVHLHSAENTMEIQAGYDSQFEDGELRESDAPYYWDEAVEVEHVDYGSESEEDGPCSLPNEEIRVERGSSLGSDNVCKQIEHFGRKNVSVSPRTITSEMTIGADFSSGMAGSRTFNREMLSYTEGPDIKRRNDVAMSRANYLRNTYSRDERETTSHRFLGRDRAASHMRGRSPGCNRFGNPSTSYWDSKRPTYRGTYISGPPRLKDMVESSGYIMDSDHTNAEAAGFARFENHLPRQHGSSSNGMYSHMFRRSPSKRNDAFVPSGMLAVRDTSPVRKRFRRFLQGIGRGMREEYRRTTAEDDSEYSKRLGHRLVRRERSISPLRKGRPLYAIAYKKSSSRSRSRSPIDYLPPRERNEGSRFHSRSPDFRSNGRMDRVKLPFQKRFAADYEDGLVSPTRRFSPQHSSRWYDDRNGALVDYRGWKSPVRVFRQNQRFDSKRSIRRLNSHDQFRPMIKSRKFVDTGAAGRGSKYEGGDDDGSRRSNRYEVVHRARRYETEGVARRFHYNVEDSFVVDDSHGYEEGNRVTDRRHRDALRRVGEEQ